MINLDPSVVSKVDLLIGCNYQLLMEPEIQATYVKNIGYIGYGWKPCYIKNYPTTETEGEFVVKLPILSSPYIDVCGILLDATPAYIEYKIKTMSGDYLTDSYMKMYRQFREDLQATTIKQIAGISFILEVTASTYIAPFAFFYRMKG